MKREPRSRWCWGKRKRGGKSAQRGVGCGTVAAEDRVQMSQGEDFEGGTLLEAERPLAAEKGRPSRKPLSRSGTKRVASVFEGKRKKKLLDLRERRSRSSRREVHEWGMCMVHPDHSAPGRGGRERGKRQSHPSERKENLALIFLRSTRIPPRIPAEKRRGGTHAHLRRGKKRITSTERREAEVWISRTRGGQTRYLRIPPERRRPCSFIEEEGIPIELGKSVSIEKKETDS